MRELHLHRLHLQVLGRDSAHLVGDLVAFHWDVLALDAVNRYIGSQHDSSQVPVISWNTRSVWRREPLNSSTEPGTRASNYSKAEMKMLVTLPKLSNY